MSKRRSTNNGWRHFYELTNRDIFHTFFCAPFNIETNQSASKLAEMDLPFCGAFCFTYIVLLCTGWAELWDSLEYRQELKLRVIFRGLQKLFHIFSIFSYFSKLLRFLETSLILRIFFAICHTFEPRPTSFDYSHIVRLKLRSLLPPKPTSAIPWNRSVSSTAPNFQAFTFDALDAGISWLLVTAQCLQGNFRSLTQRLCTFVHIMWPTQCVCIHMKCE